MDTRKSQDEGIESSIYKFLFYSQSNSSDLSIIDSSVNVFQKKRNLSRLTSFRKAENDTSVIKFAKSSVLGNQHKDEGLKESTKKLLNLLERISYDTRSEQHVNDEIQPCVSKPIKCQEDGDDCSIYNRLTRRCQCLNNSIYNDFILHFNEQVKYTTCDVGEIIKNMRILKRFLYMGDGYTRNALLFLREGLTQSLLSEKAEIIQGCVHADICNIFEDHSVVTTFIIWPCKYTTSGDYMTQVLIGVLLYKIASTEEGKRYLNLNSKISHDIRNALKKHSIKLNKETVENINNTLNLLELHYERQNNVSCSKRNEKGVEAQTLVNLFKCRKEMTISEVALSLEILKNCSKQMQCKLDLTENLAQLLPLLKNILRDCDSSEINITTANILRNVFATSIIDFKIPKEINNTIVMSTATEPIEMKSVFIQVKLKQVKKRKNKVEDVLWDSFITEKTKKSCDKTRIQTIIVPVD